MKDQRRLSVQEQIAIKKKQLLSEAKYWREHGIPTILEQFFIKKGLDTEKSIILNYEQDFPGINTDEGIILTPNGEFFEFSADLNSERTELIELYNFSDISTKFEINEHKKGIGKTYGFLAIEVLKELNDE